MRESNRLLLQLKIKELWFVAVLIPISNERKSDWGSSGRDLIDFCSKLIRAPGRTWVPSALPGLFNALAFPPYCAEEMAPLVDSKNRAEHCSPIARLQTFWLNVTARCRRVVRSRSRTKIRWPLSNSRAALPLRLCLAKKARQERLEHPMTRTI